MRQSVNLIIGGVFILSLFFVPQSHAEPFLDLGLGATVFVPAYADGTWYQEGFPHNFTSTALALKTGLGWRFNQQWSVTGNYLRLGSIKSQGNVVADEDYSVSEHRCLRHCEHPVAFHVEDSFQGGELALTYTFQTDPLHPFLRAGGAWFVHTLRVNGVIQEDQRSFPASMVGSGVCYQWLCAEVSYYHIIAHSGASGGVGYPLSTNQVVSLVSLKVPLW